MNHRQNELLDQYRKCLDEQIKGLTIAACGAGVTLFASLLSCLLPLYTSVTSDRLTQADRGVRVQLIRQSGHSPYMSYTYQGDEYIDRECNGTLDEVVINTSTNGKERKEFMRVKRGDKEFEEFVPYFESIHFLSKCNQHL